LAEGLFLLLHFKLVVEGMKAAENVQTKNEKMAAVMLLLPVTPVCLFVVCHCSKNRSRKKYTTGKIF
jgi:hypothetical protein